MLGPHVGLVEETWAQWLLFMDKFIYETGKRISEENIGLVAKNKRTFPRG